MVACKTIFFCVVSRKPCWGLGPKIGRGSMEDLGSRSTTKQRKPIRTKTSHAKHARTAETATWENMARARAIESDDTLLRSIGYVCLCMSGDFSSIITAWRSNTSTDKLCYCRWPLFESRIVFSWDQCLEFALDIHHSIRFLESAQSCAFTAARMTKHHEDLL